MAKKKSASKNKSRNRAAAAASKPALDLSLKGLLGKALPGLREDIRRILDAQSRGDYKTMLPLTEEILSVQPDFEEIKLYRASALFQIGGRENLEKAYWLLKDLATHCTLSPVITCVLGRVCYRKFLRPR